MDVNDSIKDQNARNWSKRTEHGSRVRDEIMNVVWAGQHRGEY